MVIHVVLKERSIDPEFIIMYPSLGCPGIALSKGGKTLLHVVLLVKNDSQIIKDCTSTASKQVIARSLSISNWPINKFKTGTEVDPGDITDIQWDQGWTLDRCGIHQIELSAPSDPLSILKNLGYDGPSKFLHLHLQVGGNKGFYNLVNRDRESEFVRKVLKDLKDPDGGELSEEEPETLGYRGKDKLKVQLYHPFLVTDKEYLTVAHVTDPHISTHWKLYERRLKIRYGKDSFVYKHFNNYNSRFLETLEEINSEPEIDVIILTGDLIDYNKGHIIDVSGADGGRLYPDGHRIIPANYRFNRNWVFFYELLLSVYKKPIFTILGNHEYLLNPYPSTNRIMIRLRDDVYQSFAGDMNLTYRTNRQGEPVPELPEIAEVRPERVGWSSALDMRAAMRDYNEVELANLLPNNNPELLKCPKGIWCHTREAVYWYHLVINPFADFTFAYINQSFLMLDWKGARSTGPEISQVGSLLILPKPEDCISGHSKPFSDQAKIVDHWFNWTREGLKILCTHAPLLSPWPDIGNFDFARGNLRRNLDDALEDLHDWDPDVNINDKLDYGTIEEESRKWLLSKLLARSGATPGVYRERLLILSGHSHGNRIIQFKDGKPCLRREDKTKSWDLDSPFIIVTTSCGPIGRENEVSQWMELVPPGYRVIKFKDGRMWPEEQIKFIKDVSWLRDRVKNQVNNVRYNSNELVTLFDTHKFTWKVFNGRSGLIQNVDGKYEVSDIHNQGDILVIKKIEKNGSVTINRNNGVFVVLENEGNLTFEKNNEHFARISSNNGSIFITNNGLNTSGDQYIRIEENKMIVTIVANNDQIKIGNNAKGGDISILSNGKGGWGDDLIEIKENHGKVTIRGNDDRILIKKNHNEVWVFGNKQEIRVKNIGKGQVFNKGGKPAIIE